MEASAVAVGQGGKPRFIPIHVDSLRLDSVADFDLYLDADWMRGRKLETKRRLFRRSDAGHEPVLYRRRDLPVTLETVARLRENHVELLYLDARQEDNYRRYLERHLGALLTDPDVDVQTKAAALYDSVHVVMKDILAQPMAESVIARSTDLIQHAVSFMLKERDALDNLMRAMSADYYTYTHSANVFVFCVSFAQRLLMHPDLMRRFAMGALLHDIGKSRLDPDILTCTGKLSDEQWGAMKLHPMYGCEILEQHGITDDIVLDVVRHHHEKLDGSGYPDGLVGEEISTCVRCATISDIFDALSTKRAYKDAMGSFPSLELIKTEMAGQIDSSMFRTFVLMVGARSA